MSKQEEGKRIPYYSFGEGKFEARFWSCGNKQIAIVATVTRDIDWAAYIGADTSDSEIDTLKYVARYGCKLAESDARHFFPEIKLPYRR